VSLLESLCPDRAADESTEAMDDFDEAAEDDLSVEKASNRSSDEEDLEVEMFTEVQVHGYSIY
jgi:hypothetical protein